MHKNRILAISKSDMLDDELIYEIKEDLPNVEDVFISSIAQTGIVKLKDIILIALNN